MLKKCMALILAVIMLMPVQFVLADSGKILVSESFSTYAENETSLKNITVATGVDSRVIEDNGNKVLYSKAWEEDVTVRVPIAESKAQSIVISLKAKILGDVYDAKLMQFTMGGKKINFLKSDSSGNVMLADGLKIGGLPQKWRTYTAVLDIKSQKYDFYVDQKCVASDWFFVNGTTIASPTEVTFMVSANENKSAEAFIDNVRIYEGSTLPWEKAFSDGSVNTKVKDFTPTTALDPSAKILKVAEKRFDFDYFPNGGTLANADFEDGIKGVNFKKSAEEASKSYGDVTAAALADVSRFVMEIRFRINKISGNSSLNFFDARNTAGVWRLGFSAKNGGNIVASATGAVMATYKVGEWVKISAAYDVLNGSVTVYANGQKKTSFSVTPDIFVNFGRIDFLSGTEEELDVDINYVRIYKGQTLLGDEFFSSDGSGEGIDIETSIMDPKDKLENALKNKSIFMMGNNYMYVNGEKKAYPDESYKPCFIDGTLYMPKNMLSLLTTDKITASGGSKTVTVEGKKIELSEKVITKGSIVYFPLIDTVKKVLKQNAVYDKRDSVIISPDEIPEIDEYFYKQGMMQWKDMDLIYRFMQFDNPTGDQIIKDLKEKNPGKQHPRIMYTYDDVKYMLKRIEESKEWQEVYDALIEEVDTIVRKDLSAQYNVADSGKQVTARDLNYSMQKIATAYLLTGDTKYLNKGLEIMDGLCSWSGIAYKISGELTGGHWYMVMAVGYDAFYNYLSATPEGRAKLKFYRDNAVRVAFTENELAYSKGEGMRYVTQLDNFLGVIGGGLCALVLALADEEDMYSHVSYLSENVLRSLSLATSIFAYDGGYFESHHYGGYMNENLTMALNALFISCGTDYGIGSAKGYSKSGHSMLYLQTPNNRMNFADGGAAPNAEYTNVPFFMGYRYGEKDIVKLAKTFNAVTNLNMDVRGLLHYEYTLANSKGAEPEDMPLDMYFKGAELGTFSSSRIVSEPSNVFFHGGLTNLPHDSLDTGEFTYESDGILWIEDIGNDSYNLPNYFRTDGYKYYRKRPEGENCVVLNPAVGTDNYYGQVLDTKATLIDIETNKPKGAKAVYDLTEVYGRDAKKYHRGYYFGDDRNTLVVQDELTLNPNTEVYSFYHTAQKIDILGKTKARLTAATGETLTVDLYCSAPDYEFKVMPAQPLPTSPQASGQNPNTGFTKLAVHIPSATGDVTISIKFSPDDGDYTYKEPVVTPIKDWTIPDGEAAKPLAFTGIYYEGKLLDGFLPGKTLYTVNLPVGTSKVPEITATADEGTVKIDKTDDLSKYTTVSISAPGKRTIECKVYFEVQPWERQINVKDAIIDTEAFEGTVGTLIKPVAASLSIKPIVGAEPAKMIDDDINTSGVSTDDAWHEVDLGEVMDIDGVAFIFMDGNLRNAIFDILYSEDGVNYTRVFSGKSTGKVEKAYESIALPGRARYIRYCGFGNSLSNYNNIIEFRAYKK